MGRWADSRHPQFRNSPCHIATPAADQATGQLASRPKNLQKFCKRFFSNEASNCIQQLEVCKVNTQQTTAGNFITPSLTHLLTYSRQYVHVCDELVAHLLSFTCAAVSLEEFRDWLEHVEHTVKHTYVPTGIHDEQSEGKLFPHQARISYR